MWGIGGLGMDVGDVVERVDGLVEGENEGVVEGLGIGRGIRSG